MEESEFKIGLLKDADMAEGDANHPPKTALIRNHLRAVLDLVELTNDGKAVAVDGFRFLDEETVYPLQ